MSPASRSNSLMLATSRSMLLSKGAVPVDPAAYVEAVTHHALGEQKKDDCEDDYKQETSDSESRWLSSRPDVRLRHARYFTPHGASCAPEPKSDDSDTFVTASSVQLKSITCMIARTGVFGTRASYRSVKNRRVYNPRHARRDCLTHTIE